MARHARSRAVKTVRAIIRDRDSLRVTNPVTARGLTMPLTTGRKTPFDDRATLVFNTASSDVLYPFGFKQGDVNMIGSAQVLSASTPGLVFPNRGGGLLAMGNIAKGVVDAYVSDIPGSLSSYRNQAAYPPFIEQNLFAIESASLDDPFYQTGSRVSDVGLGLTQPLWSKTRVDIDIDPIDRTIFGYTQEASVGNQQPKYTPTVYYNFGTRVWDVIGRPIIAAGFRDDPDIPTWLSEAPIGFTRGTQLLMTATNLACLPCSNFGFPIHPKFHAKQDQTLCLSGVIDRPFLLEKFVYEADVEYLTGTSIDRYDRLYGSDGGAIVITGHAASIMTFFMLNQRAPASASVQFSTSGESSVGASTVVVTASLPNTLSLSGSDTPIYVDTSRDLVAFAQIVSYSGSSDPTSAGAAGTSIDRILAGGLARDLNIDVSTDGTRSAMSRRIVSLSGSAKQTLRLERQFGWRIVADTKVQFAQSFGYLSGTNVPGGRTNHEMVMTGRDFVASQPGGVLGSRAITDVGGSVLYPSPTANTTVSPYLLMPSDELVCGWQVPHLLDGQVVSASQISAMQGTGPQMTIYPGKGKLTLYGSILRDGVEFHDTLRQSLVSDAVFETFHSDNPITDQFDTEPFYQLSGSHVDNIVSGAMHNNPDARGVYANNANPGAPAINLGTTQSDRLTTVNELRGNFRAVTHICPSELFFDCLLPDPSRITHLDGANVLALDLGGKDVGLIVLDVGTRFGANSSQIDGDSTWSMAYPFEPRYSDAKRGLSPFSAITTDKLLVGTASLSVSSKVVNRTVLIRPMLNLTNAYNLVVLIDANPDVGTALPLRDADARKHYFGIGDLNTFVSSSVDTSGSHNIPDVKLKAASNTAYGALVRGWKYGIKNGLHEYTRAVFRRDRFGQCRDMLEQRPDSKFYIVSIEGLGKKVTPGEASSPVTVNFVTSDGIITPPNQTYSSNLSHEATSSLPYFDGSVRNREDPLDLSQLNNAPANV